MLKRPFVFIDASAWVALMDMSDGCHARASMLWRSALEDGRQFLTTDYVLDEASTLLRRRRRGLKMAAALHDLVVANAVFEPLFDRQPTIIMGDIAVDPSNPQTVWVGSGENNSSRSSYGGLARPIYIG